MKTTSIPAEMVKQSIREFIASSPKNRFVEGFEGLIWEEAIVGFASGDDPIFDLYKSKVGEFHLTPLEAFQKDFPEESIQASDLSVISFSLPMTGETKDSNRSQILYPSKRWLRVRAEGDEFIFSIRQFLIDQFAKYGILAISPNKPGHWMKKQNQQYGLASTWSERHIAYACGLGTFGLCEALITAKGKAHRLGSVIAKVHIPPTGRPYSDHHAYCLHFHKGNENACMACAKRCPVGAITKEGHDKIKCKEQLNASHTIAMERYSLDMYGCGLCQVDVPCENGIPGRINAD